MDTDHFKSYLSDSRWQVACGDPSLEKQNTWETLFTLGNGYLCSRGVLEENPGGCMPGTYFAGIFDRMGDQVPEIVNLPNPFSLRICCGGQKLDLSAMEVLDHRRILDMRRAILTRRTLYQNARKQRFAYESMRFVSLPEKHLVVMRVFLTPLDAAAVFTVHSAVDISVRNPGTATEGERRLFIPREAGSSGKLNYVCVETLEKHLRAGYAAVLTVKHRGRERRVADRAFDLSVQRGQSVCLTLYVSIFTSRDTPSAQVKDRAVGHVKKAAARGFDAHFLDQSKAWAERWNRLDVQIDGDPDTQRALRFNLYHLMILANEDDPDSGIGAKGLHGHGYRGHSFWDTELFTLPFYIYQFPQAARNLLTYRFHRLSRARAIAASNGFKGAMFPWESADTGEEATPAWHKDLDGTLKKVITGTMEIHITADIAYAVVHYYHASDDEAFMLDHGLEMLMECARFWASRVTRRGGRYEIRSVIGPDEFHENVDNSAFTNLMAAYNLETAALMCRELLRRHPQKVAALGAKIRLQKSEPDQWRRIAAGIVTRKKEGVFEEFDGYFRRKEMPLPEPDDWFIPGLPDMPSRLLEKTKFVKQADMVMAAYLLPEKFGKKGVEKNYNYYEPKTLHKSSLSASIHATLAARLGLQLKARRYLKASLETDWKDIYGNTREGIHVASMGGTWQAVVMGFGGVDNRRGLLCLSPKLPGHWNGLSYRLGWKGGWLGVDCRRDCIRLHWQPGPQRVPLKLLVQGVRRTLPPNHTMTFSLKSPVS